MKYITHYIQYVGFMCFPWCKWQSSSQIERRQQPRCIAKTNDMTIWTGWYAVYCTYSPTVDDVTKEINTVINSIHGLSVISVWLCNTGMLIQLGSHWPIPHWLSCDRRSMSVLKQNFHFYPAVWLGSQSQCSFWCRHMRLHTVLLTCRLFIFSVA